MVNLFAWQQKFLGKSVCLGAVFMKKIIVFFFICFITLGISIADEPEWWRRLGPYVKKNFSEQSNDYEFVVGISYDDCVGGVRLSRENAEKNVVRKEKMHFGECYLEKYINLWSANGILWDYFGTDDLIDEDENAALFVLDEMADLVMSFSDFEFLEYAYEKDRNPKGKNICTCFVLARIPRYIYDRGWLFEEARKKYMEFFGENLSARAAYIVRNLLEKVESE